MKFPRTDGVSPGRRRLQLGLSAIIGRKDGSVVEIFPDGTERVLMPGRQLAVPHRENPEDPERSPPI